MLIKNILNYKKPMFWIVALVIIAVIMFAVGLAINLLATQKSDKYDFTVLTSYKDGDKYFICEDKPENEEEELIYQYYLYDVKGEFDKKKEIYPNQPDYEAKAQNEAYNRDEYTNYVFHSISTLSESEAASDIMTFKSAIEENKLVEYIIIQAAYTTKYSLARMMRGPQFSEGVNFRTFLVGKTADDNKPKLYELGMPYTDNEHGMVNAILLEVDVANKQITVGGADKSDKEIIANNSIIQLDNAVILDVNGNDTTLDSYKKGDYVRIVIEGTMPSLKVSNIQLTPPFPDNSSGIFDIMIKSLSEYPEDYLLHPNFKADRILYIENGKIASNTALWDTFIESTKFPDEMNSFSEIIIVRNTKEGDPIFTKILHNGTQYYAVTDNIRDKYKGNYDDYQKMQYDYLKIFEDENKNQLVFLTNDDNLTLEKTTANNNIELINELAYSYLFSFE